MIESLAIVVGLSRIGILRTIYRLGHPHRQLQFHSPSSLRRRFSSSSVKKDERSFTVSYLVNQCGISSNRASALSKYVNFETLEQPNSVLRFFRDHNFSATQISKVVNHNGRVLLSDPTKTLLPKLQFLRSLGFSTPEVAKAISASPPIMFASLKNQLVPCFEFYIEHYKSNDEAVAAVKRSPSMLVSRLHRQALPVLEALREAGVPERAFTVLIRRHRNARCIPDRFRSVVAEVVAIGIDPTKFVFVEAVCLLSYLTKSSWEKKLAVYAKWGWSKEQAIDAFRKWPQCFRVSEEKIMGVMNVFVNKLGWESSVLAQYPSMFAYSPRKRLLPRVFVLQFLDSEGVLSHNPSHPKLSFFIISEKKFLEKYVIPYSESSSLLKMYLEKKSGLPCSRESKIMTPKTKTKKKQKRKTLSQG